MESIVITWRELLIVVVLFLAVYVAEMLLLMRTGTGLLRKRSSAGAEQSKDESALRDEVEKLGARIAVLEQYIQQMQSESTEETPYNRAIQLARLGRDVSRISESCGISRGEAELIVSMHGPRE
jgi:cell division protein FtsB